ncbi:hypothetical protein C9J21_17790 [Photobacterium phosphoreum]|uniref:hypothetical protein n=1 Tax=Photobacterium phosphoreum TaxID=659 RepID=UPI000D172F15|nr:hypothetical protein [Photobacterium phosphoreum]PSW31201.1 hypothetical protein C9J21_17790 [Photobacterium phosphoreum]
MKKLMKVVMGKAKLSGTESEAELHCMLFAHTALKDNGLISSYISFDTKGHPEFIVSLWKLSELENGTSLPKGQRFAYILAD